MIWAKSLSTPMHSRASEFQTQLLQCARNSKGWLFITSCYVEVTTWGERSDQLGMSRQITLEIFLDFLWLPMWKQHRSNCCLWKSFTGQRLSARIKKEWIVINRLVSNFVRLALTYVSTQTVKVTIYVNRKLVGTMTVVPRFNVL